MWEVTLRHMVPGTGDLSKRDRVNRMEKYGEESVYLKKEIIQARIVVSAVGGLVEPNDWPVKIPGRDKFEGEIFHSARWRYDVDMKDKNVIVVGTGCSAAQFVPRLTKAPFHAKSVTQLMRSPAVGGTPPTTTLRTKTLGEIQSHYSQQRAIPGQSSEDSDIFHSRVRYADLREQRVQPTRTEAG